MGKILIKNAVIITEDMDLGVMKCGSILIEDSKIVAVQKNLKIEDAQIIDGTDMIAIPGFVDAHRHTWQALIRSIGVDWDHAQYFTGVKKNLGPAYSPEMTFLGNYLGALECINAGITTVYDWFHNNNSPEHADAAVQGLQKAGIRAVFGYSDDAEGELPVSDKAMDYNDARRISKKYFSDKDQLLTMAIATRGPQFLTMPRVIEECKLAKELDIPIAIHVGDGLWGKSRPVEQLVKAGLIDHTFTCIHCNTLADDEFAMLGEVGVDAVFCPEVELNMGHGFPAALRLQAAGIAPGLGIDVCTSIPGDMFGSMRAAMMGIRAVVNQDALVEGYTVDPLPVTATDILRYATQNGANACKLGSYIGSITPGKQADIVLLNTCAWNLFPILNPIGAVVEAATVQNVDTVIINGEIRKRNGVLLDVDLSKLKKQAEDSRNQLFKKAGIPVLGEWKPELYENRAM